jgi:hypothetical protein
MVYPILGEFLRWKQKFVKYGRIFSKSGRMPENSLFRPDFKSGAPLKYIL